MLVDITFIPFTEEQQASYRESVMAYNLKHPDEPLPLEMRHPPRLGLGVYAASNFNDRQVYETVVEDVPPHLDWRLTRQQPDDDRIRNYIRDQRKYKRQMDKLYSQKYKRGPYRDFMSHGAYGLCDTPEQFFEMYPHIQDDNVPRFLTFHKITRANQHPTGGFRYHKNGNYIGKQKPRHEYLYDDTHIDFICGFHVYRVEDVISG